MVWFCLKHRKSMTTLLKIAFPLARKIQNDPKTIERLVQWAGELVTTLVPQSHLQDHELPLPTVLSLPPNLLRVTIPVLSHQLLLLFPLLHHNELIDVHLSLLLKLHKNYTLKDNCRIPQGKVQEDTNHRK